MKSFVKTSANLPGELTPFINRLRKRHRHLSRWARRVPTSAYRIYDQDIPDFPLSVDWFDGRILLIQYPRRSKTLIFPNETVIQAVGNGLGVASSDIYVKVHEPKRWGHEQYSQQSNQGDDFIVEESGLKFWVNLSRYLDPGLFIDHRIARSMIRAEAQKKSFLNLFSYTGSFSVYAAAGGASMTASVDLSNTYLSWAKRNFSLNNIPIDRHEFIRADVRHWLATPGGDPLFDVIVLDPPSFSSSKAMKGSFDVQRDHAKIIKDALARLRKNGTLYFSTSYRRFELDYAAMRKLNLVVTDITKATTSNDFRNSKVHQCWRLRRIGFQTNAELT